MGEITTILPFTKFQYVEDRYQKGDGYYFCKRVMDVFLSSIGLLILTPLIILIAILIKLDSPGPVFFVQKRVGSKKRVIRGKTVWEIRVFRFYKFRSMFHGTDPKLHQDLTKAFVTGEAKPNQSSNSLYKLTGDPRVTRIGSLLRRTSLDELPQILNVLKGDMSLIGPRPVPTYEVELYGEKDYDRLASLPGISGVWQVEGRGRVTFDVMVDMDRRYIREQCIWLDLKLLLKTIPAIVSTHGAE